MRLDVDAPALLARLGVSYQRRGRALWARCPLAHGGPDADASWSIRDDPGGDRNGAHWCFGCKQGGGPADLAAAVLGVDLRAAIAWVREGGSVREGDIPRAVQLVVRMGRRRFTLPDGVSFAPLADWPTPARAYLERRGVTPEQVARWGLGYAVEGRLAGRVVVPVRDRAGAVASFTARAFGRAAVRYFEPRQEDGADPGALLGEHLWPAPGRRRVLLAAEGFFDSAALERAAAVPVAALRGSPTPSDARWPGLLARLSTFATVVHAVDAGGAGARLHADLRAALSPYARVVPVWFERGDAAALAEREGDAALARLVERALAGAPESRLSGPCPPAAPTP